MSSASSGAWAILTSDGWETRSRGAKSVNNGRLCGGVRTRRLEQQLDSDLQPLDRLVLVVGGGANLVGRSGQGVFEQREQQLVLAVKLQVEASQRLPRAVDDLLHGEVRAALFDDDRLCGVKESLNALSGPELGGLDRSLDRALLPGGFFAGAGHRRLRCGPSGENMN